MSFRRLPSRNKSHVDEGESLAWSSKLLVRFFTRRHSIPTSHARHGSDGVRPRHAPEHDPNSEFSSGSLLGLMGPKRCQRSIFVSLLHQHRRRNRRVGDRQIGPGTFVGCSVENRELELRASKHCLVPCYLAAFACSRGGCSRSAVGAQTGSDKCLK